MNEHDTEAAGYQWDRIPPAHVRPLSCPFCDCDPRYPERDERQWRVRCRTCGADGPPANSGPKAAIELWNLRAS